MPGAKAINVLPSGPVSPVDAPQLNITVASAGPTHEQGDRERDDHREHQPQRRRHLAADVARAVRRRPSPRRSGIVAVASETVTIECGTWVNRNALA